jgi:uncharacterized protein (TIGR00251 family)
MMLSVRVVPNASRTAFSGFRENELLLRLNAPPIEGRANKAAIAYIAHWFGVPRSSVSLVSGEKSRHKKFQIVGLNRDDFERKLADLKP